MTFMDGGVKTVKTVAGNRRTAGWDFSAGAEGSCAFTNTVACGNECALWGWSPPFSQASSSITFARVLFTAYGWDSVRMVVYT